MGKRKMFKLFALTAAIALFAGLAGAYGWAAAPLPNFVGVNYGPFHKDGQLPGTPIPDSQFIADFKIMASKFTFVKTYGLDTASRLDQVVPLVSAHYPSLKIFLGVFETGAGHAAVTQPQLDLAIQQANAYPNTVKCVVVGNECTDKDSNPNPVSITQLIQDLQYVRAGITNKKILVTTCLGYAAAQAYGTQLMPYCDVMMVNIYPFYAGPYGIDINGAWSNLASGYGTFANQFAGKQTIIGETGWPSGPAGVNNGSAVPSVANEKTYTNQILQNGPKLGPIFAFEAFDEPWKTNEGSWGPYWGIWDKNGSPKFTLSTFLTRDTSFTTDLNSNGVEEVALLRHDLDRGMTVVHLRDGETGNPIKTLRFLKAGWTPAAIAALADLNSNGFPELAVLGTNENTGDVQVEIRDSQTGDLINRISFDARFTPKELVVRGDNQIAVMGTDSSRGLSQLEVRNPLNGALVKIIRWNNEF
jgi:exo-beta-1,3-glucanase (GH17 family)